jgi:hypothetical protein
MLDMGELPEVKAIQKTPEQGAATSVYAALSRDWEGKGGMHVWNCAIMGPFRGKLLMDLSDDGYAPYVYNAASECRLWKDSLNMVGLEDGQ